MYSAELPDVSYCAQAPGDLDDDGVIAYFTRRATVDKEANRIMKEVSITEVDPDE